MKNISKYEDFINESGIYAHPTGEVTDWVQLHKPDTAYKFCVVKKTMRKHGEDYATHSALRIEGPNGIKDYKITSKSPIYQGGVTLSDFWKSTRGDFYVIKDNEGERRKIEAADMKKIIEIYNSEGKQIPVPTYDNSSDAKSKIVDLIFNLTSDWKNIK